MPTDAYYAFGLFAQGGVIFDDTKRSTGAISRKECSDMLAFARKRRRMRAAHENPKVKCWKSCVFHDAV